jgi:hypothetical protein
VRLAQTLLKAALILAVIAVALGGAVALGSTLFDAPPRDAADFAAQIEAGSVHAAAPVTRTKAERRYVLDLTELCQERNEDLRTLGRRVKAADQAARLRGWQTIFTRFSEDVSGLSTPKAYEEAAGRSADLVAAMLAVADGALQAKRDGDRETFEAKTRAAELLDARYDQAVLRLDAPACATA